MDTEQLFSSLQRQVLQTPAYQYVPTFPGKVERIQTLEELVWWLGSTDFSSSTMGADYAALSMLAHLHAQLDASYPGLMRMISFITNIDAPGFLLGHEQPRTGYPPLLRVSRYEAADAIAAAVRRRPHLRKAVAQYIIFEDLGCYDTVTLAQIAQRVEQEYRWQFGDQAFASSTRDVARALEKIPGTEREHLHKMLALVLEIGTHHIRSRLAVNWLAQVQLHDPSLQQEIERLRNTPLKVSWQEKMASSTDDPDFLSILLRGCSFEGQQN